MTPRSRLPQRVRDPVHGLIVFGDNGDSSRDETDRIAWTLLNAPEFQRLRRIRQLGFSDLVFPGATHSRFAHSVGVYHVARQLADVIARRPERRDPERERIALLAALLHDVGHGPFSHAFEAATETRHRRAHEQWSAEIVEGDTQINSVLRETDNELPSRIGSLLRGDDRVDIYATIVSSQFDADRLDYLRRDRMAAGVQFGHVDCDWLFDCLEVGDITVGEKGGTRSDKTYYGAPCLYLGPKGVSVAEEYIEARFRLYRMLYMHKTTRAAEKMLEALFASVMSAAIDGKMQRRDPLAEYLVADNPSIEAYLKIDDAAVWSAMTAWSDERNERISTLARRLRERNLYKCVDIGVLDVPEGNLFERFRRYLRERPPERIDDILLDDPRLTMYTWYDFDSPFALNKILVKTRSDTTEPKDISTESEVIRALRKRERIRRAYAPDPDSAQELRDILRRITA